MFTGNACICPSCGCGTNRYAAASQTRQMAFSGTLRMACSDPYSSSTDMGLVCTAAVANELWFQPERSSVCGMCLKISLPPGTANPDCQTDAQKIASCPGAGTQPYTSVDQPWAWNAKVYPADTNNPNPYFIAVIIEWFDRYKSVSLQCHRHPLLCPYVQHNCFSTYA